MLRTPTRPEPLTVSLSLALMPTHQRMCLKKVKHVTDGHTIIADAYREAGVEVQQKDIGNRSILTTVMERILTKDKVMDLKDLHGYTAIHQAASTGSVPTAKCMVQYGADVNSNNLGERPLHLAAKGKHRDMVEFLLSCGADSSLRDRFGLTPAEYICGEDEDMSQLFELFGKSTQPHQGPRQIPMTPLSINAFIDDTQTIQELLEKGEDVNAVDGFGRTALMWAAIGCADSAVQLLLRNNAKLPLLCTANLSAIHYAAATGYVPLLDTLCLTPGAVPHMCVSSSGVTPLHLAGSVAAVEYLLTRPLSANAYAVDVRGDAPIHYAAKRGVIAVALRLCREAPDLLHAANCEGKTPLQIAGYKMARALMGVAYPAPNTTATSGTPPTTQIATVLASASASTAATRSRFLRPASLTVRKLRVRRAGKK